MLLNLDLHIQESKEKDDLLLRGMLEMLETHMATRGSTSSPIVQPTSYHFQEEEVTVVEEVDKQRREKS